MSAYLAILKARLFVLCQYRAAAIAGLATQFFWGVVKTMILTAFYAQTVSSEPITLQQAITFIWVGQALLLLLPWNVDKEVEAQVKSGNVAYELIRPLDLYWYWFSRSMAMRIVPTILRSIPLFVLAGIFFDLPLPISWGAGLSFIASILFSVLLSASITTVVIISLFWTLSGEGIQRLLPHTVILLSGMVVPLPLFPEWLQPFLSAQPFRGILDIPLRLYTGVISADHSIYYLGFQLCWTLFFVIGGKWLMGKAVKQIVIQGG